MPRRCLPAVLALALVLPATAAAEPERRYDVELVIIENTDTSAGERERWRPQVNVPPVEGAILLDRDEAPASASATDDGADPAQEDTDAPGQPGLVRAERLAETPEGFEPLPPERMTLGGAVERLQESGRYRVLRHLAWRQPALDEEESVAVRAWRGEPVTVRVPITDFEELYALEEAAEEETGTGTAAADTGGEETGGARTFGTGPMFQTNVRPLLRPVRIHPLDGTVRVVVSRYLHVYTDLHFTTPVQWTALPGTGAGPDAGEETAGDAETRGSAGGISAPRVALGPDGRAMLSYPFVQHRRMRSGELHYLDHPVLGMLIRVDRAPEEDEEGQDAPGDTETAPGEA